MIDPVFPFTTKDLNEWRYKEMFDNYNAVPPNICPISKEEYIDSVIHGGFYARGSYQVFPDHIVSNEEFNDLFRKIFNLDDVEFENPSCISLVLHIRADGSGVGVAEASYKVKTENGWYVNQRVFGFVAFAACQHKWTRKTIGRCLHEETCVKCGFMRTVDSSD